MNPNNNSLGTLGRLIQGAADEHQCGLNQFTVLSRYSDPYRRDTPADHRDGRWFAEMVERFLAPDQTVHLRGLHYIIASAANVRRPDNPRVYINDLGAWDWLSDDAAKAARWLGYVPFERIVDERNAPPQIFVPSLWIPSVELSGGIAVDVPPLEDALPRFVSMGEFSVRQPYRIILIGEKTSLGPVLLPIAQMVRGELLLPTGEASDTMIAELAARAAADSRPTVVLYFSDFDPSGYQMPISVARKLQALHDLLYPDLDIQLHPVALTLAQVRRLGLPSTPLKEKEKRADRWRTVMQHEQTEIDALAALQPDTLREIALNAVRPFFDETLAHRTSEAQRKWTQAAAAQLRRHRAYRGVNAEIEEAHTTLSAAAEEFHLAQDNAREALRRVPYPEIILPEPQIDIEAAVPLFSTKDDFEDGSRRLIEYKALGWDEIGSDTGGIV